ncbi:MAG: nucleotidyl transferase AbiEii/AbiGii toxin family protein [Micromonosporaceae bacterium]
MNEIHGDFEIHLTVWERAADRLADFATRHGLTYTEIVLDRGEQPVQPMLNVRCRGTLQDALRTARHWRDELRGARLDVSRTKLEAAPWNTGVPGTDAGAAGEPRDRYFEHHVKLLLPDARTARLVGLTELVTPHQARLSHNARRVRDDGRQERFVTQRCHRVGRETARRRLDALLAALRQAGHEPLSVEQEYVVSDNALTMDRGWIEPATGALDPYEDTARKAPAWRPGYPGSYQPLPDRNGVRQRAAFDPALKQFTHAYRAGEPHFADAVAGQAWRAARTAAMHHVLAVLAGSPWAGHLVLRGSVPLQAWLGWAAREPHDLDFVVMPHTWPHKGDEASRLLDGVVDAIRATPGAGLDPEPVAAEDIWTYERAAGSRLVFRFATDGLPPGSVQLDFVFQEPLPVPPVELRMPPLEAPVLTAPPELALAWKLLWLETDGYPQGKDLYDAALLAEYARPRPDLICEVLRTELAGDAERFGPGSVLRWAVDWQNFRDEYPDVEGDADHWQHRLALALAPAYE